MYISLFFLLFSTIVAKNIIYIVVDDLRLDTEMYTPNIDRLIQESFNFNNAYCQQALCGPSRTSFLTGRRPDTTRIWNLDDSFRNNFPNWTTLPGLFKKNNYQVLGSGKIFHPGQPKYYDSTKSWSKESLPFHNPCYWMGVDCLPCWPSLYDIGDVTKDWCKIESYSDTYTVDHGIKLLKNAKEPFFIAIGLHKPHLPWQAKKEHFDIYNLNNISLPKYKTAPIGMPDIAWADTDSPSPLEPLDDNNIRIAKRGYYAAVTGMDEQLGRILDTIDKNRKNFKNEIVTVFHSDHGWQLGEHAEWRKFTNFELSVRVPLLFSIPSLGYNNNQSDAMVELVDILPTLADIANIKLDEKYEGVSLLPILNQSTKKVKDYAISQYPRNPRNISINWANNSIVHSDPKTFKYMGYTVRSKDWRYTGWYKWNGTRATSLYANELYDHRFHDYENESVVYDYPNIVSEMSKILGKVISLESFK